VRPATAIRVQGSLALTATSYVSQRRSQPLIDIYFGVKQREVKMDTRFGYMSCQMSVTIFLHALTEYLHSVVTMPDLVPRELPRDCTRATMDDMGIVFYSIIHK
jgi:hypothetical protein